MGKNYHLGADIQEIKESLRRIEHQYSGGFGGNQSQMQCDQIESISGGVRFKDVERTGDRLCATVEVWGKITAGPFEKEFDKTFSNVYINVGDPCYELFGGTIAGVSVTVDVCYRAPDKMCIELTAKALGQSKTWDKCKTIE